ncbi:MAG: SGNH/GDSL hydrolase family protein [Lachnospiraceae bacterium]|nr:SGNH/GDSL hydrolase family protein [Lachnospiraceae bacterium]
MEIFKIRSGLKFTREAIERGRLVVGYLGGSITDGRAGHNWSDYFSNWLCAMYPDTRIVVENAAMGATGSDMAVLRVEKQIIERQCNLVFIEYAVNDQAKESVYRYEAREGLLRKLMSYGKCDIVLVYTYCKDMYEDLVKQKVPATVQEYEVLAQHYGISSVWPGLKAYEGWQQGLYQHHEWMPDGLHPQSFGSNIYAHCVKEFFKLALTEQNERGSMPEAMYENNWENVTLLTDHDMVIHGNGYFYRAYHTIPVDLVFHTKAVGAKLSFDFYGTGCVAVHMVGMKSYALAYRIDNGEWIERQNDKYDWMEELKDFNFKVLARNLERKKHHVEIKAILSDSPKGIGDVLEIPFVAIIP